MPQAALVKRPLWVPPPPAAPPTLEPPDFQIDPISGDPVPAHQPSPAEQRAAAAQEFGRAVSPPSVPIPPEVAAMAGMERRTPGGGPPLIPEPGQYNEEAQASAYGVPSELARVAEPRAEGGPPNFRQQHPILAAIGRGFAKAAPYIEGGLAGGAAGAYEPSAVAAAGKGFHAAQLLPYEKAKHMAAVASSLADLEVKRAHADYYRAQAPAAQQRLGIAQERADAYQFATQANSLYRQGMLKNRAAYQDMMDRAKTADEKRKVMETASRIEKDKAYTQMMHARIVAGEPEARVKQLEASARALEATGDFRETQTEDMPEVWASTAERNRAEAARATAGAGKINREVSVEDDAGRLLAEGGSTEAALQKAMRDPSLGANRAGVVEFLSKTASRNKPQALSAIANNYHMRRNAIIANVSLDDAQRDAELQLLDENFLSASQALKTPHGGAKPAATPTPAPARRPRAANPQTGESVEWDGKAWVPAR